MFEPRARVPHCRVRSVDGTEVDYRSIWQTRNLLLVCLDQTDGSRPFTTVANELAVRQRELDTLESRLVVTRDVVVGVPRPGVVVADRWGDIYATIDTSSLKDADDLLEWVGFVQKKCT
ncbi:MAG: hypothetical protein IT183_03300 [Acidobacteria bacterium]|nr:hypothetical protein [Acidobacteriota bacterium]